MSKSGGSLGAFDLIGIGLERVLLVQCKTNRRPSTEELVEILKFRIPPSGVSKQVHIWVDRQKYPVVMDEQTIRNVVDGEPFKIKSIYSLDDGGRRTKNNRKSKSSDKQRTIKKSVKRKGRAANELSGSRHGNDRKVRGEHKDRRVSKRSV